MIYSITSATKKVAAMKKKVRAVQGGTSASKTISILLNLISLSQTDYICLECGKRGCQDDHLDFKDGTDKDPKLTSVTSESTPHLKRGALRDFQNIMKGHKYWKEDAWNATDKIYTFKTGSQIEFFSADQSEKLRGGRRDRGFMNEVNNMTLDQFDEFEVRTRDFVYLDWNPTVEFWYYEEVEGKRDDVERIVINYQDNEALDEATVESIEQRKNRPSWWRVYGLGELGEVEGRVYTGWKTIKEIPHEAKLVRYGLDFGYTNDPTAIVAIYSYNGGYILDEITYKKGLLNSDIAAILNNQENNTLVVADSSEPKSIAEIHKEGINIVGAVKKKEVTGKQKTYNQWAVSKVQEQRISVTENSLNILKEYRSYLFQVDNDGNTLNDPQDFDDHAMDAIKYGIVSLVSKTQRTAKVKTPTWQGYGVRG